MVIPTGTEFGRYKIIAHLDRGFASELYQAWDNQLERPVTLRIFDRKTFASPAQMQQLAEDLKVASAVVHRNIAATYEIASFNDTTIIATEFVEGVTLRSQLEQGALPPLEATYVAVQIASAVAAAHEAGLIHGDIRPENIVLKPDGVVKLLGLGQSELSVLGIQGRNATSSSKGESTETRDLMRYASPERASGINADEQSDIWSVGVVLYEMLAGRPPFSGDTPAAIVAAVLKNEPSPIAPSRPTRPSELDAIIRKALRRQKSERYGSARELSFDLKRLWQRMEVTDLVHRIHTSSEGESAVAMPKGPFTSVPPASRDATRQSNSESSVGRSEASPTIWSAGKPHRRIVIAAAAVIIVAIASIALYRLAIRSQKSGSRKELFQSVKIDKLTTSGKVTVAAISPDGRSTVHAIDVGGKQSLWVRQLASTNVAQIVPPADVEYQAVSFSNDGNSVFYVLHNKDNPIRELYQVATFGGSPRRLLVDVDSPVSFSPDGKSMAFVRRYSSAGEDALMIAGADGRNERRIATRKQPSFFSTAGPAWSPDGKLIAVGAGTSEQGKTSMSIAGVTLNGGTETPLTDHSWYRVGRVAWAGNNNTLLVNAVEQTLGPYQIWQFNYPGGEVRKITNDASDYRSVTVSNDASTIVTVQSDQLSNIWVAPGDNGFDKAKQISSGKYDGFYGVSAAPDGKLVYATNASGKQDIWTMDLDGSGQRQITSDSGANVWPSVSPDGRSIIFTSDRTGVLHIWKTDRDGNNLKQLTFGEGEDWARFTPDGKWVVYALVGGPNRLSLWKTSVDGGQSSSQIAEKICLQPSISPDGKFVACGFRGQGVSTWKLTIFSFDGGPPLKMLDLPQGVTPPIVLRWSPDGRDIAFINTEEGRSDLWLQPVAGGAPRKLTSFTSDQIFSFDWTTDGLAYARGMTINDVVTIRDTAK